MKFRLLTLAAFLISLIYLPTVAAQDEAPQQTIAQQIAQTPELSILNRLLALADPAIVALLDDPDAQLTLFAPTDDAFQTLFADLDVTLEGYVETYPDALNRLLRRHIVPATTNFNHLGFVYCDYLGTMQPDVQLFIDDESGELNVGWSMLNPTSGQEAANGWIFPTDDVLGITRVIASAGDHSPDAPESPAAVTPDDEPRLAELPADIASAPDLRTFLETDGSFTTLLSLLEDSPVMDQVGDDVLYTVFAPRDAAFAAYFEANNTDLDGFSAQYGADFVASNFAPGYLSPEFLGYALEWSDMFSLCSLLRISTGNPENVDEMMIEEIQITADGERILVQGVPLTGEILVTRNAIIYVVDGLPFIPFRG